MTTDILRSLIALIGLLQGGMLESMRKLRVDAHWPVRRSAGRWQGIVITLCLMIRRVVGPTYRITEFDLRLSRGEQPFSL